MTNTPPERIEVIEFLDAEGIRLRRYVNPEVWISGIRSQVEEYLTGEESVRMWGSSEYRLVDKLSEEPAGEKTWPRATTVNTLVYELVK